MTADPRVPVGICLASLALVAVAGVIEPLPLLAGPLLVLVLSVLAFVSPMGVTMAMIVVLPYFYRPLHAGTFQFATSEFLLIAALAGAGSRTVVEQITDRSGKSSMRAAAARILKSRLIWFLVALIMAGVLTTVTAFDPGQRGASLRELRWTLVEPLLLVALLLLIARERSARLMLLASLVASGVLAAAHGLLDLVTGSGVVADNVRRLSGPLPHPNALALYMVRPLAVAAAVAVLVPRLRRFAVPSLVITGLVMLATFSRGAMLAAVALAFILSLQASRRARLVMFSSIVAAGAFAFIVAGDRMRNALEGGSVSLRIDIWTSALNMIRDSPVWGYGPDQFLYAYAPRYILPTAWNERFTSHAHNLILDSWIRLGVVGAIAACVALVVILIAIWRRHDQEVSTDWIPHVAVVALAATMVHGLIDNAYFGHDLAMSSWLLAWLAFSPPGSSPVEVADEN